MAAPTAPEDVSVHRVRVPRRRPQVLPVQGLQARRPHAPHPHPLRGAGADLNYRVGRPICRKVFKIMFWEVPLADWLLL